MGKILLAGLCVLMFVGLVWLGGRFMDNFFPEKPSSQPPPPAKKKQTGKNPTKTTSSNNQN